jgi:hypothetical protein
MFLVRHRRPAFGWTVVAVVCLVGTHAAFWIWIAPVNATLGASTASSLPPDWMTLRDRWEYTHAARAILQMVGLGALVYSVLTEVAVTTSSDRR